MPLNLPNLITVARLLVTVVFLVVLSFYDASQREAGRRLLDLCTALFLVAALGDVLDGYLARARNQVTSFGRVLDPFVDKVLICGAFAFFAGPNFRDQAGCQLSGVGMWVVVLILGRELLIMGLRVFLEARGTSFGADLSGKAKMLVQSVTAVVVLMSVARPEIVFGRTFNDLLRPTMVWLTVVVTAFSMLSYMWRTRRTLFERTGV